MGYFFIFLTIILTVYAQLIVKHELNKLGVMPTDILLLLDYLKKATFNLKIFSGSLSFGFAVICWLGAISRLDLSFAYPFMSLTFPIVLFFSIVFLQEPFYWSKFTGILFIVVGLLFISLRH